jgi:hypothetical protein
MSSTFDYKEGKKTNIILQESNILATLSFKTSMILTAALITYNLWGYCTSNAMATFDTQSMPGIPAVRSGVPLHKI